MAISFIFENAIVRKHRAQPAHYDVSQTETLLDT